MTPRGGAGLLGRLHLRSGSAEALPQQPGSARGGASSVGATPTFAGGAAASSGDFALDAADMVAADMVEMEAVRGHGHRRVGSGAGLVGGGGAGQHHVRSASGGGVSGSWGDEEEAPEGAPLLAGASGAAPGAGGGSRVRSG